MQNPSQTRSVGLTVAATITPSAFAGGYKKDGLDKYMKGRQNSYKKGKLKGSRHYWKN